MHENKNKPKNEWTIIFLIYADLRDEVNKNDSEGKTVSPLNKNRRELRMLFNEIRITCKHPLVDIFVLYNVIRPYKYNPAAIIKDTHPDFTWIFKLTNEQKPNGSYKLKQAMQGVSTFLLAQKTDKLSEIIQMINLNYPSHKKMLITWDHGSFFGINRIRLEQLILTSINLAKREEIYFFKHNGSTLSLAPSRNYYTRYWENENIYNLKNYIKKSNNRVFLIKKNLLAGDVNIFDNQSSAEAGFEILTNEELNKIIKNGFGGEQLNLLLMMNCFAQNTCTGFALKDSVKTLTAPEGIIDEPGYFYAWFLSYINNNPEACETDVSSEIIKSLEVLKILNNQFAKEIDTWGVFTINHKPYDVLIKFINVLSIYLLRQIEIDDSTGETFFFTQLRESREESFGFDQVFRKSNFVVDLKEFLFLLDKRINSFHSRFFYHTIKKIENDMVINKYIGNNIYSTRLNNSSPAPAGIAIFFPLNKFDVFTTNEEREFIEKTIAESDFIKNTKWDTFINEYLRKII